MLVLSMLFSVCMVAAAADTPAATGNSLRSQGAIHYQEGTESVVIDSADLYTLADRLDLFKVRTVEQLGVIGTYLSGDPEGTPLTSDAGIYAVHQKPSSSDEADPLSLSFETILEGIAASQTIPTDPAAYGMESGTTLYKDADGKLNSDAQEGAEEVRIQTATAENLSAGTAAWENGHLLLGTGGDNKDYYREGVQDGQAAVIANPKEYGVPGSISYFALTAGGTLTYTIPRDGTYTFVVKTAWWNNHTHQGVKNTVTLKIGSETITVFNHYNIDGTDSWKTEGDTNKTITKTCKAGTKITMTASERYFHDDSIIYTISTLLIY